MRLLPPLSWQPSSLVLTLRSNWLSIRWGCPNQPALQPLRLWLEAMCLDVGHPPMSDEQELEHSVQEPLLAVCSASIRLVEPIQKPPGCEGRQLRAIDPSLRLDQHLTRRSTSASLLFEPLPVSELLRPDWTEPLPGYQHLSVMRQDRTSERCVPDSSTARLAN